MKKQRKRIYTALLCTCFLLSTASVPVSAAETEQEEEMTTLSSRSGEAEVSTKDELTSALGDSTKDTTGDKAGVGKRDCCFSDVGFRPLEFGLQAGIEEW